MIAGNASFAWSSKVLSASCFRASGVGIARPVANGSLNTFTYIRCVASTEKSVKERHWQGDDVHGRYETSGGEFPETCHRKRLAPEHLPSRDRVTVPVGADHP
jgi:hypothetical protein